MKTDLFHLEILPVEQIVEHEVFDAGRTQPLIERIQAEQMLVNPILVTRLDDDSYMQLDGMNRLSAFRRLGIPAIPAQIVDYTDDDQVQLRSWSHFFQIPLAGIMESVSEIASSPEKITPDYHNGHVATVLDRNGECYHVSSTGSDSVKAETITRLVAAYKSSGISRSILPETLTAPEVAHLWKLHPLAHGLVLFPTFTKQQIVSLVKDGGLLPSGITRHVVQNRILNARIPLSLLTSSRSLAEKNHQLGAMLAARAIRLYQEPVVYIE